MNYERRKELVRLIAGSLLTSARSDRELRMITEVVENEPNLLGEVVEVLRAVLMVSEAPPTKSWSVDTPPRHPLAEVAYQALQRQKMTKAQLINEILLSNPRMDESGLKGASIRNILQRFFTEATVPEGTKLLKRLDVNTTEDPYFRGIIER